MKECWEFLTIKDISTVTAGQSPEGKYYNACGNGLPFYQGKKDFGEKYVKPSGVWTSVITKIAVAGDILMSVRAPVGPVNIATEEICIGRGLASIRPNHKVNRDYVYYFFQHYQSKLVGNTGAVFDSINKSQIESFPILVPPLPEQQRIVSIIDKAFEAIDQAIANTQKNIENAKELFESYLNSVFENGGEGWEEKRFDEVCVLQRGFDLPTHTRFSGEYPLVSSNGITDRINEWKVKAPGVVTGRSGTIGNVHFIEEDFWPLNTTLYIKEFYGNYEKCVYYFLLQFDLSSYSSGSGVPTLNRNNVHSCKVIYPKSKDAQQTIVRELDTLKAKTQSLVAAYRQKLVDLEELKKSILTKAFAGEL